MLKDLHQIEKQIQKRLRDAIETSGLSLTVIAEKVGIAIATVSYYKSGKKLPTLPTLAVLCKVLDVSPNDILGVD